MLTNFCETLDVKWLLFLRRVRFENSMFMHEFKMAGLFYIQFIRINSWEFAAIDKNLLKNEFWWEGRSYVPVSICESSWHSCASQGGMALAFVHFAEDDHRRWFFSSYELEEDVEPGQTFHNTFNPPESGELCLPFQCVDLSLITERKLRRTMYIKFYNANFSK